MPAILDDDEDMLAPNPGECPVAVLSPRELALQAIEEGRVREFEQESGVKVLPQPAIDEDMAPDDVAAEQERARLEAVADDMAASPAQGARATSDGEVECQIRTPEPTVIEDFGGVMVRRKVNGIEDVVPLAEVMRTHQKASSADQRLEAATRLLREAEERSRAAPAPQPAREPAAPVADSAADIAKDITSAFFAGDADK